MLKPRTDFLYQILTAPDATEMGNILSLDEIKAWLGMDTSDTSEDTLLTIMRNNVLAVAQEMTERVFITTEFRTFRDSFAVNTSCIELRRSPFNTLVAFEYLLNDVWTAVDSDTYYTDLDEDYSHIVRAQGYAWPDADDKLQSIRVDFTAGYDSAALLHAAYPDLKAALLAHTAAVYTNRGDCDVSCDACRSKAPATAQKTYDRMRIPRSGAVGASPCEQRQQTWV